MHPKFGFRIEQVHMGANSGAPDAPDPMQHRALVGWQMDGLNGLHAANMKMEFGGRVTYDMAHSSFSGLPSFRSPGASASRPAAIGTREESKAFAVRMAAEEHGMVMHEVFGSREPHEHEASTSLMREVAASAVATFKSRATAAMQRPFPNRGRPESMHDRDGR